ncbi:DUF3080 family protein [Marinagarivorans algicola]|uniref:DUF3080 family protein n=1 Tax=Marinagarivorans algicola TaxID=1513270 RepID=UPI003734C473
MIKPVKTLILSLTTAVLAGTVMLALAGCGQTAWDTGLQRYVKRVTHVFKAASVRSTPDYSAYQYPTRRALALPLPATSISLLDFLRLSPCDLQRLVGERNSGLGKVMPASQLVFYTAQFIALAQNCLAKGLVPNDLVASLRQVIEQKQQALPRILWNALVASPEFAQLYSLSDRANPSALTQMPSALIGALEQLQQIVSRLLQHSMDCTVTRTHEGCESQNFERDQHNFEQALSVIGSSSYAGRLMLQSAMLTQQLALTHEQLHSAWQTKPRCWRASNEQLLIKRGSATALMHVLHNDYIPEVQALAVKLLKQSDTFTHKMEALVSTLGISTLEISTLELSALEASHKAYAAYWQQHWGARGEPAKLKQQIKVHTHFWQSVLKRCHLSPGGQGDSHAQN